MELAQALHCQGRVVDSVRLAFDEMKGSVGKVRPSYAELAAWLGEVRPDVLDYRRREAELLFRRIGITFAAAVFFSRLSPSGFCTAQPR